MKEAKRQIKKAPKPYLPGLGEDVRKQIIEDKLEKERARAEEDDGNGSEMDTDEEEAYNVAVQNRRELDENERQRRKEEDEAIQRAAAASWAERSAWLEHVERERKRLREEQVQYRAETTARSVARTEDLSSVTTAVPS